MSGFQMSGFQMTEMAEVTDDRIYDIPLQDVDDNPDLNCRGEILPIDILDLSKDIQTNGLLQPVVVAPANGLGASDKKFILVSGFRRMSAHKLLNQNQDKAIAKRFSTIKAVIRNIKDEGSRRLLNLSENIQRSDLNIMQEARAVDHLLKLGFNRKTIANRLNMSEGWVQMRAMALDLPTPVQSEIAAGVFTQTQIRDLYTVLRWGKTPEEGIKACIEEARNLKEKKQLGRKNLTVKIKNKDRKHIRPKQEMNAMMDHLAETIGFGLHTRVLAWASGEISDSDVEESIKEACEQAGKIYSPRIEDEVAEAES